MLPVLLQFEVKKQCPTKLNVANALKIRTETDPTVKTT